MLDDKDEFVAFSFESCAVRTLRTLREGAARRLITRDFVLSRMGNAPIVATEEELKTWIRDIDTELAARGICNKCWRLACLC